MLGNKNHKFFEKRMKAREKLKASLAAEENNTREAELLYLELLETLSGQVRLCVLSERRELPTCYLSPGC